jgi:hypothetical protein
MRFQASVRTDLGCLRQRFEAVRRHCRHHLRWNWPGLYLSLHGQWPRRFGRRHHLPGLLVVSLTSYPPRFATLGLTLHSLLRQTIRPDHLILWIAPNDLPLLPKSVSRLGASQLEIRLAEDLKSYKKIIPALERFPQAFIATADDDFCYWPTWLEELVEGARGESRVVTCHRAHEIRADAEGRYLPYREWVNHTAWRGKSARLFPTGMGGVLYPPGILTHTAEDRRASLHLCPHGDDIWLYWIGRRNGAIYKTVGQHRMIEPAPETQAHALWRTNVLAEGNDHQIRLMAQHYGYPALT